jgi:hypothetical protein
MKNLAASVVAVALLSACAGGTQSSSGTGDWAFLSGGPEPALAKTTVGAGSCP